MRRLVGCLIAVALILSLGKGGEPEPPSSMPGVFDLPRKHAQRARLQMQILALFEAGDYAEAEDMCVQLVALMPRDPGGHYNLACARARQGKKARALQSLGKAVLFGFNDVEHIKQDPDLEPLRGDERFAELLENAATGERPPDPWKRSVKPSPVEDGKAVVTEDNVAWDGRLGVFRTHFQFSGKRDEIDASKNGKPIVGHGPVGKLLREWYAEGTSAGNQGDFYDNHDADHSNMAYGQFPQLTRIEFSEEAKRRLLHSGLQNRFIHPGVTLGNSSTAITGGPFWRSQPRLAYTDPRMATLLYAQYVHSHLYVYPEHRDHDVGENGDGGYGDVYPANTPYLIISQGSSGSDRVFLDAVACTLAAFRPEVKRKLTKAGTLMPTVQMILRSCYKSGVEPADYRNGETHPTVFDGKKIDVLKMVKMAHRIKLDETPPMVQLRVIEEDEPVVGRDYFAPAPRQKLFTTPSAIARVHRTTRHTFRMVVSAEGSRDLDGRKLTWHWKVLRGDADAITIRPLNDDRSIAELIVPYHARRPVRPNSPMESSRVDIGVFAHNGKHYSAPGFVSFVSLDNEERRYDEKNKIQSIQYNDGNYSDPLIALAKSWRDEYKYDEAGQLVGWTRHRGGATEDFTPQGALIKTRDDRGRPRLTRPVQYVAKSRKNKPPILEQATLEGE